MKARTTNATKALQEKSAQLPVAYDYGEHAGAGFEDFNREDFALPFLNLLQANSPVLLERQDLKAGMIYNSVSGVGYDADIGRTMPGVEFVPFHRTHVVVEWTPRDAGGGYVGEHALDAPLYLDAKKTAEKFGKYKAPNGNELKETFNVFGLHVVNWDEGLAEPAVMAFTSTKIKVYRVWMTRADALMVPTPTGGKVKPPLFAHRYRINSILQQKGNDKFFNLQIAFAGDNAAASRLAPDHPIFQAAVDLYASAKEGKLRANTESLQNEPGSEESDGPTPF